jgi:hypothetical protein
MLIRNPFAAQYTPRECLSFFVSKSRCGSSITQKQSVSNAFQYVVLCPTAPSASDDITAYGQIAAANLDKIFEIISQKK